MNLKELCIILLLMHSLWAFEGRPVFDEQGNETGLHNINPDPNGEPWIVGGMKPMTEAQRKMAESFPELELTAKTRNRVLPREVLLMENKEFPPVFNQVGGSCAQASGVAYLYSYQMNVLDEISGTSANTKAYGFTHNYLNDGNNSNGSWYWDGWAILQKSGAPTKTIFHDAANGGLSGTRWMNGGDRWHEANDNRVDEVVTIKVTSMDGIEKIKNWMYDLNGQDPKKKGGCVVFAANGGSAGANSTVSSGPHAGEPLCTKLTKDNMNHAMTFAGYSDDVAGGAVLLLNSWGSGWGNGGTVWVPYTTLINGGLYNNEVWCVTTKKHTPKLELRAKVKHNSRNQVKITTGMSNNINATSASETKSYGRAFSNGAGAYPMEGKGGSQEIEVSLDVSEFYDKITSGEAKFFFVVKAQGGSGTIRDLTLLDYTQGSTPVEFVSEDGTVTISGSSQLTVVYSSAPRITVTAPNGGEKIEQYSTTMLTWGDNIDGTVKIELLKGSTVTEIVASTESDGLYEWSVPADLALGADYKIRVTSLDDPTLTDESDASFEIVPEYLISQFPFKENFDALEKEGVELPMGWSQQLDDDIDWIVWSGPTPSRVGQSPDSTGPEADVSGDGIYLYVEASDPNNPGKSAVITSPKFNVKGLSNPLFTCRLHMFSARKEMGKLSFDISVDGQWKRAVQTIDSDQGDSWIEFKQPLSDYIGERVQFRFSAETGDSWCSDICIDEILVDGSESNVATAMKSSENLLVHKGVVRLPLGLFATGTVSVELYTPTGRSILRRELRGVGENTITLDELSLAQGVYFCKVQSTSVTKVFSFMHK